MSAGVSAGAGPFARPAAGVPNAWSRGSAPPSPRCAAGAGPGRLGLAALSVLFVAGCSEGTDAPLDFGRARIVSAETDNGATPMLFTRRNGDRILAWVSAEAGGSDGELHFSVTRSGRAGPDPTVSVRDPIGAIEPRGEAPPKIAEDPDGTLYAMYTVGRKVEGLRFPQSSLRLVRSDDGGQSWTPPITVNSGERFGSHNFHSLHADAGLVVASWLTIGAEGSAVAMSRSEDRGATFEPERVLPLGEACPCCRTSVAIAADRTMYLTWRKVDPGDERDLAVVRSDDLGDTWSAPVEPRDDGWVFPACPHAGPSLAVDPSGGVHVAWWTGKEGEAGVYYARSTDGGRSWMAQPMAVGPRSMPAHVQLAVDARGVFVVWDDGLGELPVVTLRRSTDGGVRFGPPQTLSAPGVAGGYPVIALSPDSVRVAWSQKSGRTFAEERANQPDHGDPEVDIPLERVGQTEILLRSAARPEAQAGR